MEMNLESIRKFVNERVEPIDFLKLLKEAGPEDDAPADDGAEDAGGEDLGGDEDLGGGDVGPDDMGGGDDFGGDFGGPSEGPSGDSGEELGDDTDAVDHRFDDREDDPDFTGISSDGSAAEGKPSGEVIYDIEGVLKGINNTISSSDVNLAEIETAKNVLEVIANGKKLKPEDFDSIKDDQSFSDLINRSLFQTDDKTQNYFKLKIKSAILDLQNQKKIDAAKETGEVDSMRNLASKF